VRSRERQLKWWKRKWKQALIEQMNPEWKDLSKEILDTDNGFVYWVPDNGIPESALRFGGLRFATKKPGSQIKKFWDLRFATGGSTNFYSLTRVT